MAANRRLLSAAPGCVSGVLGMLEAVFRDQAMYYPATCDSFGAVTSSEDCRWFQLEAMQRQWVSRTCFRVTIASVNHDDRSLDTQLGSAIRDLRRKRGLSQGALAEQAGVDRKTINRIENGHHSTTVSTLAAIADSLGEKPSVLLAHIDELTARTADSLHRVV